MIRLIQIPFSHNCMKVRRALDLKALPYEIHDIHPAERGDVVAASGQPLVPTLVDEERSLADSTQIMRYLETAYPDAPSLLPEDPRDHADCWLAEDWADVGFMALTRRLGYWHIFSRPGGLERLFYPDMGWPRRWVMGRVARRFLKRRFGLSAGQDTKDRKEIVRLAGVAVERLGGRTRLFGNRTTVADIALAAMSHPAAALPGIGEDPAVRALGQYADDVLGEQDAGVYRTLVA